MKSSIAGKLNFSSAPAEAGLERALGGSRADVIDVIGESGLRGRAGAGFPVGVKWNLCAASHGESKLLVCNANEGEPGAFKDRVVLSGFANLVFEGMTIAGFAVGAAQGILYLRAEYSYLRSHLESVLGSRRERGLLGERVFDRDGFDFDIRIQLGSGSYVCGEETALIESLEGQRGEPRNRPPFPVDTGFLERPTVVNNVETLAWAACIVERGAEWFRGFGSEESPGLELLSVSGDCERPGVYEMPMGISVRKLLREVGGEQAKAVLVGGASGRLVTPGEYRRTISYEDLPTGGAVIVIGEGRDLLDVAHSLLEFFVYESCGQCTPCREGNRKLLDGVEMLRRGRCANSYLEDLCRLGESMQLISKCGLGQSSPRVFLALVEHFSDELLGREPS
jgi:[NiFe] hydrogenase diaphorase moiety large subunit